MSILPGGGEAAIAVQPGRTDTGENSFGSRVR